MLKTVAIQVQGRVQGVGFRPFVYALAQKMGLNGWVNNSTQGATVVITADEKAIANFIDRLKIELPPPGLIEQLTIESLTQKIFTSFTIRPSGNGSKTATILPDLSTCSTCLTELFDPGDRRYLYPFINCTHCGPRYTIIEALPYDRCRTTMAQFHQCVHCQREYERPGDRRFHAQPNACPCCGPQLAFWDRQGRTIVEANNALNFAADRLKGGNIIAIKSLGGFHLCCDATNFKAVAKLRVRKHRPDKPLAVMYGNLGQIIEHYQLNDLEVETLKSSAAPIVLLAKRSCLPLAENIAPGNPRMGVMLAYTPLHHLLLKKLNQPIVATSGNLAGEPICIDNIDALVRLQNIADGFLVHDRPIVCPVDDSVVQIVAGEPLFLRRARGYAPQPITLPKPTQQTLLAVGGHYKNTVAIANHNRAYISQHLGELNSTSAYQAFEKTIAHLSQLYDFSPQEIVADLHPDYLSHQYAEYQTVPVTFVQHHYAHILAIMTENKVIEEPVLGIAWDGTGYGMDGTIWGGEFLRITDNTWQRIGHLQTFSLLGNRKAIQYPYRIALVLLWSTFGDDFPWDYLPEWLGSDGSVGVDVKNNLSNDLNHKNLRQLWQQGTAPLTSSMGRLFDGIAALMGLIDQVTFEGQAAMALEAQAVPNLTKESYPLFFNDQSNQIVIDWRPLIKAITREEKKNNNLIATKFHNTLVNSIVTMAQRQGIEKVALGGGCFQNGYLLSSAITALKKAGFDPLWPKLLPPNDGGLCLGQLLAKIQPRQYID
ncbi:MULTISPECIES: carbamoyltransferase HypF [unclassified Synechocystis]|uniref:carbamoyltransferase HypF n=1 Tax=unclassified Synechocystis TaxID=2640012 RepID=UPI00040C4DD5|nr:MULTISPECIES: carbamoyltransferase HypF [unclassified Synechocystis]AIE75588.1 [NiFe] hydrogenase metallocenter assembly protein HypF [Synechocystis sp. PCC 6714]MCT0253788.1 carbamoyltransferase HypF [Synechocystis sp. CS-94]